MLLPHGMEGFVDGLLKGLVAVAHLIFILDLVRRPAERGKRN